MNEFNIMLKKGEKMIQNLEKLKEEYKTYEKKAQALSKLINEVENFEDINLKSFKEDIKGLIEKFKSPNVVISVVAEVSNGKSTFLNSLVFKSNVLHNGIGAVTATIFRIEYADYYSIKSSIIDKKFSSIEELQTAIKEYNKIIREKVDNKEKVNIEEVVVTLPNENLKQGIVLYDTPGFGSLDEDQILPILKTAVFKSDAVIMLLDISQGLKKGEKEFVKTILKSIPPKKRYIVMNKIDAVISEDDLELMDEEEIQAQLKKVTNDTLKELANLSGIEPNDIRHYKVSAKKALIGYIKNRENALKESGFIEFEKDLWEKVISEKEEVFSERINNFKNLKNNVLSILDNQKKQVEETIQTLESLKEMLLNQRADIEAVLNSSIHKFKAYKDKILQIDMKLSSNDIFSKIENIIQREIYESLNREITITDKLKFWKQKEVYDEVVKKALKNAEKDIKILIQKEFNKFIDEVYNIQEDINRTIDNVNGKLSKFENLNISKIEKLDVIKRDEKFVFKNVNKRDIIQNYLGDSIDEFDWIDIINIFTNLVDSIITYLSKFYINSDKFHKDMSEGITREILENIKGEFEIKLKQAISDIKSLSFEIISTPSHIETRLREILRSLESHQEKEKEIQKNRDRLEKIENYISQVKSL